jgi:hypothetical protein
MSDPLKSWLQAIGLVLGAAAVIVGGALTVALLLGRVWP